VRVHLAVEHALQLELTHVGFEAGGLPGDVVGGALVVFRFRQVQQLTGIGDAADGLINGLELAGQPRPLLAQLLGLGRVLPDLRIFELEGYFLQPLLLAVVLKETPEERPCVLKGP
jgi:hypothetical protein